MTIKGGTNPACAVCKYQRRKCSKECALAPYFPADKPEMFQNAHRLFGVRNITRILEQVDDRLKDEAMRSIIYESDMRARFPIHGCLGAVCQLQLQTKQVLEQLHYVRTWLEYYKSEEQFNRHQIESTTSNVHSAYQQCPGASNALPISSDESLTSSDMLKPGSSNATQVFASQEPRCDDMPLEPIADSRQNVELLVNDTAQLSLEYLGDKEIKNFFGHTRSVE